VTRLCKIKVQLDSDKPDMLLAAIKDGPVLNWQKGGRISGGGCIINLITCLVVKCLEVTSSTQNLNSWFACANLVYIFEQKLTII
jgi:hypothetical protein